MRTIAFVFFLCVCVGAAQAADWPLFDYDAARSGLAAGGPIAPGTVGTLRVRWHISLGAIADSAPIVVGDRIYQTARDGTTYAIDATDGRVEWRFTTRGPKITTSVPAYDAATHALYVPGVDGFIHKLDPRSGSELREGGFPERITLAPETEKDASSLNVANGYLYAQTSGYIGDATPYVGHVIAIRLSDGSKHVFNTLCAARHSLIEPQSCDAQRSGMWSRAGVVVDPDPAMHGQIYVATGNAPFDAAAGNYGDSILSLNADASRLLGYLTPSDQAELDADDLDVGSSSPALLPRQTDSATPLLAVQGGKDRVLRLFDRTHMPGLGAPLQRLSLGAELFTAPAVWTDRAGAAIVFVGIADGVHAYRLTTVNRVSRLSETWHADVSASSEGSSPVVSNGVMFVATSGQLIALDAETGRRLWSNNALGPIHWQSPSIGDGAVYCSDQNGTLTAFALPAQSR